MADKNECAPETPAAVLFRPEDLAMIQELRELARKYGYREKEAVVKLNAPVYLEKGGTMALFSMTLGVYRWGEDPFKEA
jgi:hypothetical protein